VIRAVQFDSLAVVLICLLEVIHFDCLISSILLRLGLEVRVVVVFNRGVLVVRMSGEMVKKAKKVREAVLELGVGPAEGCGGFLRFPKSSDKGRKGSGR
jgi:hypothetical protein